MRRRALLAASQMMGGESDNGLSDYFHVISHEDQEISFSFESQYNFNDGSGWHDLEIWEPVSIPKDSILYVANTDIGDTFPEPRVLDDAQNISLAGNIMSLVYGHNFREQYSLKGYDYIFYGFAGSELYGPAVKSIENLILPAIELSEYCYSYMFNGNVNIKKAPELPATILAEGCYMGMFSSCESLNYIKMLATDISDRDCLNSWVERVSPTGTFVKHPEATWDVRGDSGVPKGWTIKFDIDGEDEDIIEYRLDYDSLLLGELYWMEIPGFGDIFRADALYVLDKYGKVKESGNNTIKYCDNLPAFYSIKASEVRFTKLEAVYNGDILQYLYWFGSDGSINYEMELENDKFTFYKYASV